MDYRDMRWGFKALNEHIISISIVILIIIFYIYYLNGEIVKLNKRHDDSVHKTQVILDMLKVVVEKKCETVIEPNEKNENKKDENKKDENKKDEDKKE